VRTSIGSGSMSDSDIEIEIAGSRAAHR